MIYYAGIGSRETPEKIMGEMHELGKLFARRGYTLRSGGADGADLAFEFGCDEGKGEKEIFLPWKLFNKNCSPLFVVPDEAYTISQPYHPTWFGLKPAVKKLMARNAQQVLGKNLDTPSAFVVCWTPDGCTSHNTRTRKTGGTGQAISIASERGVPVINLHSDDAIDRIERIVEQL